MKIVIIGIGDEYRHDDGLGPLVLRRLRSLDLAGVTLADSDGEPSALLDLWDGADLAIIVDAVSAGGTPGRIYRLGLHHPAAAGPRPASSHAVSLGDAVGLARALGRMPRRMLFYGVQVADVSHGVGLSPSVEPAVDKLVAEIAELLAAQPLGVT